MIKLVDNWQNKNLKCCACGETKSVKYEVETVDGSGEWVPLCNKCAMVWEYQCPVCDNWFYNEGYTTEDIKNRWVGATTDCIHCDALLLINEDLTCSDFNEVFKKDMEEYHKKHGRNVEVNDSDLSYIECYC